MEDAIRNGSRRWNILAVSLLVCGVAAAQPTRPPAADSFTGHPRVVIISDIGNEPDDQMSFVRLLLYSNELDLEAMIATTSTWQRTATHHETMHAIVQAYGQVRPNLRVARPRLAHGRGARSAHFCRPDRLWHGRNR